MFMVSKYSTKDVILVKLDTTPVSSFLMWINLLFFKENYFFKNKYFLLKINLDNSSKDKPAFFASGFS